MGGREGAEPGFKRRIGGSQGTQGGPDRLRCGEEGKMGSLGDSERRSKMGGRRGERIQGGAELLGNSRKANRANRDLIPAKCDL